MIGADVWQSEMSCEMNALGGECGRRINVKIGLLAIPYAFGTSGALAFLLPPENVSQRLGTAGASLASNLTQFGRFIYSFDSSNWFHYHAFSSIILNIVCIIGAFVVENHRIRRRAGETKVTLSEAFLVCTTGFWMIAHIMVTSIRVCYIYRPDIVSFVSPKPRR